MESKIESKLLYKFLKKQGALCQYIKNCIDRHPSSKWRLKEGILTFLSTYPFFRIGSSFSWEDTEEGWRYWSALEEKYLLFRKSYLRDADKIKS